MKKRSILLVDDEELIRITIQFQLSSKGFAVETASNGEEAIEKLGKNLRQF